MEFLQVFLKHILTFSVVAHDAQLLTVHQVNLEPLNEFCFSCVKALL